MSLSVQMSPTLTTDLAVEAQALRFFIVCSNVWSYLLHVSSNKPVVHWMSLVTVCFMLYFMLFVAQICSLFFFVGFFVGFFHILSCKGVLSILLMIQYKFCLQLNIDVYIQIIIILWIVI